LIFKNQSTLFDSCVWDFGDGTTSNLLNPQHIYNIAGTFNVTLVVYNIQYGCSDILVKSGFITINPSPSAVISVNDSVTCDPLFNFQFSAQMQNTTAWTWDFGDGTGSTQLNPSHTYLDTGYFHVSLILTSVDGCKDTISKNNYIHIKWNPIPIISSSGDSGCEPYYVSLITNYYSGTNYTWEFGKWSC
jgi:PKD repeat protein